LILASFVDRLLAQPSCLFLIYFFVLMLASVVKILLVFFQFPLFDGSIHFDARFFCRSFLVLLIVLFWLGFLFNCFWVRSVVCVSMDFSFWCLLFWWIVCWIHSFFSFSIYFLFDTCFL
jgi:hypothetical protein